MKAQWLFRGVSRSFHERNGGGLRPKTSGAFTYNFHWDEPGLQWDSGATSDCTETNAAIRHQLNQEGFPTAGISTTTRLERAEVYARGKDGDADGFVYRIDRGRLAAHGVREFVVANIVVNPSVPEDQEVILVTPSGTPLPPDLIVEVIPVSAVVEGM